MILFEASLFLPSTNFVTWHADPRGLSKDLFSKGSEYLSHFPDLCMRLPALFLSSSTFALVFPSLIWTPVEAIHIDLCILHQFPLSQGLTFLTLSPSAWVMLHSCLVACPCFHLPSLISAFEFSLSSPFSQAGLLFYIRVDCSCVLRKLYVGQQALNSSFALQGSLT